MKIIVMIAAACCILVVDAQGLIRRGARSTTGPLVQLMTFEDAVKGAKSGDAAGLYALAVYLAQGEEIDRDSREAYRYLCASADAGYVNAVFVKHLVDEGSRATGRLNGYIGGRGTFVSTNKASALDGQPVSREVIEGLICQYRSDVESGVLAATNEVARLEAELKRIEADEADKQRKRSNARFLASEMGYGVEEDDSSTQTFSSGEHNGSFNSLRARRLLRRQNRAQAERGSQENLLVKPIPFADAARKAKEGDGAGLYAVAIHYALGDEIKRNLFCAQTFLRKATEAGDPNATLISAMVAESSLCTKGADNDMGSGRTLLGLHREGDVWPNSDAYTGGAGIWMFKPSEEKTPQPSFLADADVAAVEALYKKAIELGVHTATNELSRFQRRIPVVREYMKADKAEAEEARVHKEMLKRNAEIANELLGVPIDDLDQRSIRAAEREEQKRQLESIQAELRHARAKAEARAEEAAKRDELKAFSEGQKNAKEP